MPIDISIWGIKKRLIIKGVEKKVGIIHTLDLGRLNFKKSRSIIPKSEERFMLS